MKILRVGTVLDGFCGGYFGRDSYGEKRIEALGADWVVARDNLGRVAFANVDPDELAEYIQDFRDETRDERAAKRTDA